MDTDLKVWLDHFEYHAERRCVLPEGTPEDLTSYERRLIGESLATLQLEERSDGAALLRAAESYEREHAVAPLARIVELLVAEEQHHADLLGDFMDEHGLRRHHDDWFDGLTRRARGLAGFEAQVARLVSMKLISKVCYRALEGATGCRQLQTLCRMLVADELAHVGFESDLLRAIQIERAPALRLAHAAFHRAAFTATSASFWFTHRRVLRAVGYGLSRFVRSCAAQYAFYLDTPRAMIEWNTTSAAEQ